MAPTKIFIVPYRNRQKDKELFLEHMKMILENENENEIEPYEIYFSHQCDYRPFNRGAMKNIGFLAMKEKYPEEYKNITFIFNDIDTYPSKKGMINYDTITGVVKHHYGFKFALGGIFSIKGADFEKSQGFPNLWGWGLEDNEMNTRCLEAGLKIDRSVFYNILDKNIIRTFDGFNRVISKRDVIVYKAKGLDNIFTIKNLKFVFHNEYINVTQFDCGMNPTEQVYENFDIRTSNKIRVPKIIDFRRDWSMFKKT